MQVEKPTRGWLLVTALALFACGGREAADPPQVVAPPASLPASAPAVAPPALPRGLWVLCEGSQQVLDHPERIPALIDDAQRLGATDLFVQVYRGGRAWFDSNLADAAPYQANLARHGIDSLAELLRQAHAANLRVHAWVNVLSLAGQTGSRFVAELGRDAVLVDSVGRSLLDYPDQDVPQPDRRYYRMGTPAVYLDPAAPGVKERLVATFAELLLNYPQLAGLHLDYIRYPDVLPFVPGSRFGVGLDFGYGAPTRARFAAETGMQAAFGAKALVANRWDAWRRDQVTQLVAAIDAAAADVRPEVAMSAAVWAYADRAYLALGQDWRGWLETGTLDFAVPMAYTVDDRLLRYLAAGFAGSPAGSRIWMGLGSWLFARQPERAAEQLRIVLAAGAAGVALFSWDSIAAEPALAAALAAEPPDAP